MGLSIMLVLGVALMLLGNLLHIVGVATPHWQEVHRWVIGYNTLTDVGVGLFKICPARLATCINIDHPSSALEGVRALCILGCLLAFGAIGLAMLWALVKGLQNNKLIPMVWAAAAIGAFGFILIGVIVYAAEAYESRLADLGYSFALCIVGAIGIGLGGGLCFLGARSAANS